MKKGVSYEKFREMILSFPEVTEGTAYGSPIFKIKNKMAARLSEEFAETIVIKIDLPLRSSLLEPATDAFYITPHYAAHPLMLVKLSEISADDLKYLLENAWRMVAPKNLIKSFDAKHQQLLIVNKILETARTILREIVESDAEFILDLLNQPSFIKYIGDRNVRTVEQSRDFIESRFTDSYKKFGFGLWAVEIKENQTPIGICGFVKRDSLPDADIGFAFLPRFEKKGYGFESAEAVMKYGRNSLNLKRVLAITSQDNEASGRLLGKLGFRFERLEDVHGDGQKLKLFMSDAD